MTDTMTAPAARGMERTMPRQKKAPTTTVRVRLRIKHMIDTLAAADQTPAPDWLSDLLDPILTEKIRHLHEKFPEASTSQKKKSKPE